MATENDERERLTERIEKCAVPERAAELARRRDALDQRTAERNARAGAGR